jgi:hypothetical protein
MLHPLAARAKKPVGIFWSGLFAIKPPSHLSNKENQRFRFGPSLGFCPAFSDPILRLTGVAMRLRRLSSARSRAGDEFRSTAPVELSGTARMATLSAPVNCRGFLRSARPARAPPLANARLLYSASAWSGVRRMKHNHQFQPSAGPRPVAAVPTSLRRPHGYETSSYDMTSGGIMIWSTRLTSV